MHRAPSDSGARGGSAGHGGTDAAGSEADRSADAACPRSAGASAGEDEMRSSGEVEREDREARADKTHLVRLGGQRVHPVAGGHRDVGVQHHLQSGDGVDALLQHLRTGRTNVKAVTPCFPEGWTRFD